MSERERWIVYPLLFFALGAALRDKVFQEVETKEIVCQRLRIVDQANPALVRAELSSKPSRQADRSETTTYLRVDQLLCERVHVVDEKDPAQSMIVLGSSGTPQLLPGGDGVRSGFMQLHDNVKEGNITEVRADRLVGNRLIGRQMLVVDPVRGRPLVYAGTEPTSRHSPQEDVPSVSYQGVIYLNNEKLGLRLAAPGQRDASPPGPSAAP